MYEKQQQQQQQQQIVYSRDGGCLPLLLLPTTTTQKTYAIWVVKVGNASLGSRHLFDSSLYVCSFFLIRQRYY
jgi:hypothetical protein